jgi:hypothetical protein
VTEVFLKREALRFSADFVHLLSSERLFNLQRHLIEDYGYDEFISNYCTVQTSGSGLFLGYSSILLWVHTSTSYKSKIIVVLTYVHN